MSVSGFELRPAVMPSLPIPRAILNRSVDAFFTHIYPSQANAILHRGSLLAEIVNETASRVLLLALCAIAADFLPEASAASRRQALGWSKEAKTLLILEDEATLDTVASALILAKYDIHHGKLHSAWNMSSIASRCALTLGLHRELSASDPTSITVRETRRRLLWGCYCLDRMTATGVPEFMVIQASSIAVKLPCEEHQYLFGQPGTTRIPVLEAEGPDDGTDDGTSMMGQYAKMMGMRSMVLR